MLAALPPAFDPTPTSVEEIARSLPASVRASIEWFPNALRSAFIEPLSRAPASTFRETLDQVTVDAVRMFLKLIARLGTLSTSTSAEIFEHRRARIPLGGAKLLDFQPRGDRCPPGVIEQLVEMMHPEQIWLFGSRARGTARPDSDWDLLVVLPDSTNVSLDLSSIWGELRDLRRQRVEMVPMRRTDFEANRNLLGTLAQIVASEGVLSMAADARSDPKVIGAYLDDMQTDLDAFALLFAAKNRLAVYHYSADRASHSSSGSSYLNGLVGVPLVGSGMRGSVLALLAASSSTPARMTDA